MKRIPYVLLALLAVACSRGHQEPAAEEAPVLHPGESAHPGEHAHPGEPGHDADHEEAVVLSPEAVAASGIVVAVAGPADINRTLTLPGEIVPNSDRIAHIVPRFPGIAKRVEKDLGDVVQKGETLAIVESNESLASYEVTSLISGTVIEKHITLGEFVSDDADIYVVADLSSVWANITVYARDLPRVRRGQEVRIAALGRSGDAAGTIDYIAPVLSEATRSATARVVLRNPDRDWSPGLFVSATIAVDRFQAPLAVDDAALQRLEGNDVVFVPEGGAFHARPVRRGRTDGIRTEILDGLHPGETYVSRGAFILKSELLKSTAGHQH